MTLSRRSTPLTGLLAATILLGACSAPPVVQALSASETPIETATDRPPPTTTLTPTAAPSDTPTPTDIPSPTATPTISLTPTITPTRTRTPTFTPSVAVAYPRGRVIVLANCRHGPGAAYLHEWTLYPTDRVTILNRSEDATWVYVDPDNYLDYCWIRADLIDITGDVWSVSPYYSPLPFSTLYSPPRWAAAERNGNQVLIIWEAVWRTEDDDRGYLIEAWVCQEGRLVFRPIHADDTSAIVVDEPGCSRRSEGRIYTAEKHGYSRWVAIPWPE
jgi:hypothetical protein